MYFIAAVWGIGLGVLVPVTMLADAEFAEAMPPAGPTLWLFTSAIGFVLPCFLVKFGKLKLAALLTSIGAALLIVAHGFMNPHAISGFRWFYLPLIVESAAIIAIAALDAADRRNQLRNAPAPSILNKSSGKTALPNKKSKKNK